jgi:uncharacterized membrane protein
MKLTTKNYTWMARLTVVLLVVIGASGLFPASVQGQDYADAIVLSNMDIVVTAGSSSASEVSFSSVVTNVGTTPITSFRVRLDLRHLNMTETKVDDVAAMTNVAEVDTYALVTVTPAQAIQSNMSVSLSMKFTTQFLQQSIGLSSDGSMNTCHLIYYMRTLNEITNFTMSIAIPPHAILEEDVAAPLFPHPTSNYTDGSRSVFVWFAPRLLPGQEIAYIVKYQLPSGVGASTYSGLPVVAIIAGSILAGAMLALFFERIPRFLRRAKRLEPPQLAGISDHEAEVVQFITRKGGSCTQKEIYDELNLSQSMVSTILTTLEQRGTVRRFKDGRENMVHLME